MANRKRITKEEVRSAYQQTGLIPIFGEFFETDDGGALCGCPAFAMYLLEGDGHEGLLEDAIEPLAWLEEKYGRAYAEGFIDGFDGREVRRLSKRYQQGKEDGLACRNDLLSTAKGGA